MEYRNASAAASATSPRMTAPTAAIVISVPTPILPFPSRFNVPGTNVHAPNASAIEFRPVTIDPERTGGQLWDPKNYDSRYDGPLSMRNALARSKNMVSIRIIDEIGPQYAQDYITRFGFDAARHPPFLTMALGAGSVTPLQMVGGISVFANGGYRVRPYVIERITDSAGRVLAKAQPAQAGDESQRAPTEPPM